jgi:hypothetical protein
MYLRLASHSQFSCLSLLGAEITDVHYNTWPNYSLLYNTDKMVERSRTNNGLMGIQF